MKNRPKLNLEQQIKHLKNNGIVFDICSENEAKNVLQNNNYFFRINQYRKVFKHNADFAFLMDVSTLDMHFRRLILRLTLDIEHFLKVKIMRDFIFTKNDGYDIIKDFLSSYKYIEDKLNQRIKKIKSNTPHSSADFILHKYKLKLAIWDFIEIISFGEFIHFSKFFYQKYPNKDFSNIKDGLFNVLFIRNAAAHNNCLLADMSDNCQNPQRQTIDRILQLLKLDYSFIENSMKNHTINDFLTTIFIFDKLASTKIKDSFYKELLIFLNKRALQHKKFYIDSPLKEKYKFIKKILEKKYPNSSFIKHFYDRIINVVRKLIYKMMLAKKRALALFGFNSFVIIFFSNFVLS